MKILRSCFPFLYALFPPLFLYAYNIEEVAPGVVFVPIAAALVLTAAFRLAAGILTNDKRKAVLVAFLLAFMALSFGQFLNLVRTAIRGLSRVPAAYPLAAWFVLFSLLIALALRTRRDLAQVVSFLSLFVLLLVVMALVQIGIFHLGSKGSEAADAGLADEVKALQAGAPAKDRLPDIYYLIFDRYGSEDVLKTYFGFDNSAFTDGLRRKGFYVAAKSRCNYPGTFLSLTSSLNMDYLNGLLERGPVRKRVINGMLQDHKVQRILKALGYRYIHLGSWYEPTKSNPNADLNYAGAGLLGLNQDFLLKFVEATVFNPLAKGSLMFPKARGSILEKFKLLASIPEMEGPKFVFMHMLLPHHPFVFGPDGARPNPKTSGPKSQDRKYIDQVVFANGKIEAAVAAILAKSKIPPVIILQADEGPGDEEKPWPVVLAAPSGQRAPLNLRIRSGILNALYLPGVDRGALSPTVSPVNTFRLVLNRYFGGRYPLLKDRTYHGIQDKTTVKEFRVVPPPRSDSAPAVPR